MPSILLYFVQKSLPCTDDFIYHHHLTFDSIEMVDKSLGVIIQHKLNVELHMIVFPVEAVYSQKCIC